MEKKKKIGMSPISWTNDDLPEIGSWNTFEQSVSEIKLAGYNGCELGNKFPKEINKLQYELNLRELVICNSWFDYNLLKSSFQENRKRFENLCNFINILGGETIGGAEIGNSIQRNLDRDVFINKPVCTKHEWKILCKGINELGRIAKENYGLKLVYHYHMGTVVQNENELDMLMNDTKPENVGINYDSGHSYFSGSDPLHILNKFFERISLVHLKDVRKNVLSESKNKNYSFLKAVLAGVFTIPGDGDLDLSEVCNLLKKKNFEGWLVVEAEQDPKIYNPLESAMKARKFISQYYCD